MGVLLDPVEYINLPDALAPIPEACKKETGKFPLMPGIQMGLVKEIHPQGQ